MRVAQRDDSAAVCRQDGDCPRVAPSPQSSSACVFRRKRYYNLFSCCVVLVKSDGLSVVRTDEAICRRTFAPCPWLGTVLCTGPAERPVPRGDLHSASPRVALLPVEPRFRPFHLPSFPTMRQYLASCAMSAPAAIAIPDRTGTLSLFGYHSLRPCRASRADDEICTPNRSSNSSGSLRGDQRAPPARACELSGQWARCRPRARPHLRVHASCPRLRMHSTNCPCRDESGKSTRGD